MTSPAIRYTKPLHRSQGHVPTSPVTVGFTVALDPTTIPTNFSVFDITNQAVVTDFTTTYGEVGYTVTVQCDWQPSTTYQIQIHKDLQAAVFGTKFGRESQFSFTTAESKILAPSIISPGDQESLTTLPTFKWVAPTGATLTELQVSGSSHFEYVDFAPTLDATPVTIQTVPDELPYNNHYYWRARGVGGPWSEIRTFFYGEREFGLDIYRDFEILSITPGDQTITERVSAVTITFSSTPVLSPPRWVVTELGGTLGSWDGEWTVENNSMVWTPIDPFLENSTKYELYIDHLVDIENKPLSSPVPAGEPIYALSGIYTPIYASPYQVTWADPFTAAYYLQLASMATFKIISAATPAQLTQEHALVGAQIRYIESQIGNSFHDLGRSIQLGDYRKQLDNDAIDAWIKLLNFLRNRLIELEDEILNLAPVAVGRRYSTWDSTTNLRDWYQEWRPGNRVKMQEDGTYQRNASAY